MSAEWSTGKPEAGMILEQKEISGKLVSVSVETIRGKKVVCLWDDDGNIIKVAPCERGAFPLGGLK